MLDMSVFMFFVTACSRFKVFDGIKNLEILYYLKKPSFYYLLKACLTCQVDCRFTFSGAAQMINH